MCTLSQGLIEAGRNEVLPQLEAAIARTAKVEAEKAEIAAEKANSDRSLRLVISALTTKGMSLKDIGQMLGKSVDALQKFLLQDASASKPTLH